MSLSMLVRRDGVCCKEGTNEPIPERDLQLIGVPFIVETSSAPEHPSVVEEIDSTLKAFHKNLRYCDEEKRANAYLVGYGKKISKHYSVYPVQLYKIR